MSGAKAQRTVDGGEVYTQEMESVTRKREGRGVQSGRCDGSKRTRCAGL